MRDLLKRHVDATTYFSYDNDDAPNLQCKVCQGEGRCRKKPEGAKVELAKPTPEEVTSMELNPAVDYYRVANVPILEGIFYDSSEEAQKDLDDEDNWGDSEECEECSGQGYHTVVNNCLWNTDFPEDTTKLKLPAVCGSAVAFLDKDTIHFGLTGGGMDLTHDLAGLWLMLFPQLDWMPMALISDMSFHGFRSEMSPSVFKLYLQKAQKTLEWTKKETERDSQRVAKELASL